MTNLTEIVDKFRIDGIVKSIDPLGSGLINDTYKITTQSSDTDDYVLQRINHAIFKDVDLLQKNIVAITDHIRKKLTEKGETDIKRKALQVIPTKDGKLYHFDGNNYWRITVLIPQSKTYETVNPEFSYYTGKAFGEFQAMLVDLPEPLGETIPKFHNMEFRLESFKEAIASNKSGRLEKVQWMVDELLKRSDEMCKAERLYREGKLPKRITHCDTKVNNMLFDAKTDEVLCVIDLDTVMPNFVFSDFGDFLRTAANSGKEDDENLDNVNFKIDIFEAFARGYLKSAGSFLTETEINNLPYATALFPYMQCVRFLADYINGDTYYKILYPEHNLVRTKAQFKLLQSVEEHYMEMKAIISSLSA